MVRHTQNASDGKPQWQYEKKNRIWCWKCVEDIDLEREILTRGDLFAREIVSPISKSHVQSRVITPSYYIIHE